MVNLCNRSPYQKTGTSGRKKPNKPDAEERAHMAKVAVLPCQAKGCGVRPVSVHHAETGGGRRKNHMKVIALCYLHHQGEQGIHTLSRRIWEPIFGTEQALMEQQSIILGYST